MLRVGKLHGRGAEAKKSEWLCSGSNNRRKIVQSDSIFGLGVASKRDFTVLLIFIRKKRSINPFVVTDYLQLHQ